MFAIDKGNIPDICLVDELIVLNHFLFFMFPFNFDVLFLF